MTLRTEEPHCFVLKRWSLAKVIIAWAIAQSGMYTKRETNRERERDRRISGHAAAQLLAASEAAHRTNKVAPLFCRHAHDVLSRVWGNVLFMRYIALHACKYEHLPPSLTACTGWEGFFYLRMML